MQTPAQIEFHGLDATAHLRTAVDKHLAQLEQRCDRITAARVVVKAPSAHHRQGGLYEIHIRLELPNGRTVNVDHTPQKDERYSDLDFAINDAFKHARRQLQDHVREMQGAVKQHTDPQLGIVGELDPLGQFGFIKTDDGREIYFHRNSLLNSTFDQLAINARVSFAEEMGEKGPQASTVRLLAKHKLKV